MKVTIAARAGELLDPSAALIVQGESTDHGQVWVTLDARLGFESVRFTMRREALTRIMSDLDALLEARPACEGCKHSATSHDARGCISVVAFTSDQRPVRCTCEGYRGA